MARQELQVNGVRWVFMTKPDKEDLVYIRGAFSFHPLVMESIGSPTLHPFVEDFDDHLFLILHFPVIYHDHQRNKIVEVDFLITKETLITITYSEFARLETIFKACGDDGAPARVAHAGFLLHRIIDTLFAENVKDLDFLEKEVTRVEDSIFRRESRLTVEKISQARRDIIDFRRPFRSQATVVAAFVQKAEQFFGATMKPYLLDLAVTDDRIRTIAENQKETMDVLYETHESLMSSHISRIVATLTIFSAVILPLSLVTSVFGMNVEIMPLGHGPNDFWIIIGIMGVVAFALLLFFHKKRWL